MDFKRRLNGLRLFSYPLLLRRLIACSVLLFSLSISSSSQQYANFKRLSKKDGLSQVSVFAIAGGKEGFMWFGTRGGLNRYDYDFKVYKHSPDSKSIVSNDVRVLYSDPLLDDLWIGTVEGLSRFDSNLEIFTNYINIVSDSASISANDITSLLRDSKRLTAVRKYYDGADLVDVFSQSIWSGWYAGIYKNYEKTLDLNQKKYPKFLHIPYGGSSHIGRHTENPMIA